MNTQAKTVNKFQRVAMVMVTFLIPLLLITIVSGCGGESSDIDLAVGLGPLVEERIESRLDPIPAASKSELDSTLPVGQTRVDRTGKDGLKEVTYAITFTDGVETSRETLSEKIITRPVSEIILVGGFVEDAGSSQQQGSTSGTSSPSGSASPAANPLLPQRNTTPPPPEPECDANEDPC